MKNSIRSFGVILLCIGILYGNTLAISETSNIDTSTTLTQSELALIIEGQYQKSESGVFYFTNVSSESTLYSIAEQPYQKKEIMAIIPLSQEYEEQLEQELMAIRASEDEWDFKGTSLSSAAATAYSTIYYETGSASTGYPTVLLKKIEGHYKINASGISITAQQVDCGCSGFRSDSGTGTISQTHTFYPYSNNWTYYTPSSWIPIMQVDSSVSILGCWYTITCSNGYEVELENNLTF